MIGRSLHTIPFGVEIHQKVAVLTERCRIVTTIVNLYLSSTRVVPNLFASGFVYETRIRTEHEGVTAFGTVLNDIVVSVQL